MRLHSTFVTLMNRLLIRVSGTVIDATFDQNAKSRGPFVKRKVASLLAGLLES